MALYDNRLQGAHYLVVAETAGPHGGTSHSQAGHLPHLAHILHQQRGCYVVAVIGVEGNNWLPLCQRRLGGTLGDAENGVDLTALHGLTGLGEALGLHDKVGLLHRAQDAGKLASDVGVVLIHKGSRQLRGQASLHQTGEQPQEAQRRHKHRDQEDGPMAEGRQFATCD